VRQAKPVESQEGRFVKYLVISFLILCSIPQAHAQSQSQESTKVARLSPPLANRARGVSVDSDGNVYIPGISVPYSSFASPESKKAFFDRLNYSNTSAAQASVGIAEQRRMLADYVQPAMRRVSALYPVETTARSFGGVYADVITPKDGISAKNQDRVLINLHGGAFLMGARVMGFLESAPVASIGKIKVIAVDYRQGPEYKFPAASEDVAAVYRELLQTYKPQNIGIYGCSAGGVLTAQAVAWIEKQDLPLPGAVGIFCASAAGWAGGDSGFVAPVLSGSELPFEFIAPPHPQVANTPYFSNADLDDPLVMPIRSPAVLAKFPPTLLITSTRDVAMSSAVHTHAQLVKLGVDADLHVWEGQIHGFFVTDPGLPETREVWDVVSAFFGKHLGAN
jgi:epsilon-lactone hydrolase